MAKFYPTDTNCILALQFEDNANDLTSNGNNGSLVGGASYDADGKEGKSILLDGTGDYVNCGNGASFDFTAGVTVSAWIKKPSNAPTNTVVSKRSAYDSTGIPFELAVEVTNINWRVKGTTGAISVAHGMGTNTWYHVCGTWDGTTARVYVDAVEKGNSAISGSITTNTQNVCIGSLPSGSENFNGRIDRVFIYSVGKNSSEVSDEFNLVAATTGTHIFGDEGLIA